MTAPSPAQGTATAAGLVALGLAPPEGSEPSPVAAEFVSFAKDAQLTPAHAQQLSKMHERALAAEADREADSWGKQIAAWEDESKRTIPQGDREAAKREIETHGDSDLKALFNLTGVGSAPPLIKLLAALSRRER